MKKQYKYTIIGGIATIALITLAIIFVTSKSNNSANNSIPHDSNQQASVVKDEPKVAETYDSCLNKSEVEYRTYVTTNGKPYQDKYGNTLYDLPQADWDKINATRAKQYSECFHKYRN